VVAASHCARALLLLHCLLLLFGHRLIDVRCFWSPSFHRQHCCRIVSTTDRLLILNDSELLCCGCCHHSLQRCLPIAALLSPLWCPVALPLLLLPTPPALHFHRQLIVAFVLIPTAGLLTPKPGPPSGSIFALLNYLILFYVTVLP